MLTFKENFYMRQFTVVICIFAFFLRTWSQAEVPRYQLNPGERYFITQELIQETQAETSHLKDNTTLDINCTIEFLVESISQDGNYLFTCRYSDLSLSFFSPRADLYISSQNPAFNNMQDYMKELEKHRFQIVLSPYGELLDADSLDPFIDSLFSGASKKIRHHELFTKTIREAFGSNALSGLINLTINVYTDTPRENIVKHGTISFNARSLPVKNSFYYLPVNEHSLRVQGVGIIEESEDVIERGRTLIHTTMLGQQTYDLLFHIHTGWLIRGVSKQRIQGISTLYEHDELPQGLKIPSVTVSEYTFRGGKLPNN
jgi:hypothetical protein